jgi:hypothetical protein
MNSPKELSPPVSYPFLAHESIIRAEKSVPNAWSYTYVLHKDNIFS